ncbi:hypothetical protein ABPG74_002233 [Tetrahymena malaccensis]
MEHLDINPYTPGQVCMEINSKNSEKSIMKNLFSYFNKKQQKMNNGFNKIINSQSQSNKNQRLTIYTPMIEGLVNNKRDAVSSVDSASRKNFIQQNRNFIVKKTRPQTTNPNQRQNVAKTVHQQQKEQIYTFQELDKQEDLIQDRKNSQNIQSLQTTKQDGNKIIENNFTHEKEQAARFERQNQKQGLKQQRTFIKKSVANSVFGQTLNNSFESIQSRKNSFNRKVNITLNKQNQQTHEALETQAGTTIQACNPDQIKNTDYSQTINSNSDKYQFTQIINQTLTQQQNECYNQQKINSEYLKTEESDQQSKYQRNKKDQLDFQQPNSHFCSKSTNYQHTISSQNNDFITSQKNAEDATIDTLVNAHIKKSQDYSQIKSVSNQGVEKISNILTKKQNQESNLDLSIDQQLIDESYRNLLNERPPFNKKCKQNKAKVRSSGCLVEEGQVQKDQSQSNNSQHNSSCNQFSFQNNQIYEREKTNHDQSTQGSLNYQIQNNCQYDSNILKSVSHQQVNQITQNSNKNLNKNPYLLSDHQQQSQEHEHSKGMLSIKTQFLTQESFDKKENKEYYQLTIEEDIQNFTTIEEKEQYQKNEEQKYKENIPFVQINQNNLNQLQNLNNQEANQNMHKTPQKHIDTNINSLQNSMNQIIMKSNHITFNVMSNTKDQFNNNQSNNAFNCNSQISDNKFMTSSFDAQNQIQFDPKGNDEIKAQEQFNQMKEYIQYQIDSNKQVINQYYKNNFSSKKNLQTENQGLNTSSQKQLNNQNKPISTTDFCENKQISSQNQSRPISSKRPLVSQRKVSIEKKFNFYDELDKKLEEKKKNIMKVALETQIQNNSITQKTDNQINENQRITTKGFNSGRNNSLQINQNQQAQKIPLSQRRKSTQETSRFNTNNLVLNESKINNYNISELKGIPSKINNQIFILKDNIENAKNQDQKIQKVVKQSQENEQILKPIQSQIYYQQFLLSNQQKENIHPQKQPDQSQLSILQGEALFNQSSQQINNKQSRPPSNYQNQKQNQLQYFTSTQYQESYNIQQQQPEQLNSRQNLPNNETQDFGYHIPTNQRISRKYRSNTMDNTFDNNQRKQINYVQAHSSEKQSIQNTGRNSIAASKVKLSREEQLQIIKENKQIHQQMKQFSETINKNNLSLNQSIQNQLGSSINNFSSNCLNNLCATQQTMSMDVNNQFQSSLKKSINELTNLQTTQEFLQSMKLANNTQNSFREDLNSSQLINNAIQKYGQSSTRKQNPLLYSDQSNLHRNNIMPFTEINIEKQQNQQFDTQASQNMHLKTNEFSNSFNLQTQGAPLKSSIELNQNNVQFYENLNQNTISQEMDLDQKVYANHQYQYALKRQQRREDPQILQRIDQNNQELFAQNINQWTQSKQLINKTQQNTLELQKNFQLQTQNTRNKNMFENRNQNLQLLMLNQNEQNISLSQNQQHLQKNQQNDEGYIQSNRGRHANSKTSQRYYIQLNDDFEEKTLEYSGSKAGVDNQF